MFYAVFSSIQMIVTQKLICAERDLFDTLILKLFFEYIAIDRNKFLIRTVLFYWNENLNIPKWIQIIKYRCPKLTQNYLHSIYSLLIKKSISHKLLNSSSSWTCLRKCLDAETHFLALRISYINSFEICDILTRFEFFDKRRACKVWVLMTLRIFLFISIFS